MKSSGVSLCRRPRGTARKFAYYRGSLKEPIAGSRTPSKLRHFSESPFVEWRSCSNQGCGVHILPGPGARGPGPGADIANGPQSCVLPVSFLSALAGKQPQPCGPTGALALDVSFRLPAHSRLPIHTPEPGEGFQLEKCGLIGL